MKLIKIIVSVLLVASLLVNPTFALETSMDHSATAEAEGETWVWIGDSRTVGMQQAVGDSLKIIADNKAKLKFLEENMKTISELSGCNIIFNLGIHDIMSNLTAPGANAATAYIEKYSELDPSFFENNNVYFMSVNPTDKSSAYVNANIEDFNAEMWRHLPDEWTYLDTYRWMNEVGFVTKDGVHYDLDTCRELYNKIMSKNGIDELVRPRMKQTESLSILTNKLEEAISESKHADAKVYLSDYACIFLEEYSKEDSRFRSDYVVADIYLKDIHELKTYYQDDEKNGLHTTAQIDRMSDHAKAIWACNGDYYVIKSSDKEILRNGETIYQLGNNCVRDFCVIKNDGTMQTIKHQDVKENPEVLEEMRDDAWQIWTFGPSLLDEDGKAIRNFDDIYSQDLLWKNPRTAIGYYEPNHFCVVMISGRVNDNHGASMQELSTFFEDEGCQCAYNLDGGGTSHMWYDGEVLADPCEDREFSDILYIEYQETPEENTLDTVIWGLENYKTHIG